MEWCVGFFPLLKLMTAFSLSAKAHYNFVPNKGDPISSSYSHQSPIMMTWHLSRSKGQKMPYLLPYSSVCRMVPTQLSICNRRRATSVRAMQYKLDTTANTKIPDNLVHKLPFECFRNQFQCLERLWFNFKIYGISTQLSVVSKSTILTSWLKFDRRVTMLHSTDHDKSSKKQQHRSKLWWIIRVTR